MWIGIDQPDCPERHTYTRDITRRAVLASSILMAAQSASAADPDPALLARGLAMADATPDLRTLIISHRDLRVAGRSWHGASSTRPTNIKSASKQLLPS